MSTFILLLVCLFFSSSAFAQDARGTVTGRILDISGAVIPNAEVKATNTDTGVVISARTHAAGVFNFPFLLPGPYRLNAESTGFKSLIRDNVRVRVAETVEVDLVMEVGGVNDSVNVTAEAPPMDTATSSLGQVVDGKRINDLPLFGGNPTDFVRLSPG